MVGAEEIGWGGSRAAPGRKHDGMIRFAEDAATNAGAIRMQGGSGDQAATHEAAAKAGRDGGFQPFVSRQVPSDAARDAPEPSCHTPKTPIGRRGASLTYTADYPRGANASPARRCALSHAPGPSAAGCIGTIWLTLIRAQLMHSASPA